jgi:hypothetical protein
MYADEEFIGCKDNMKGGCYREITTLPISILRRMVGKREKYIHTSKYGEVYIEGTRDLLDDATSFYQNFFGPTPRNLVHIVDDLWVVMKMKRGW